VRKFGIYVGGSSTHNLALAFRLSRPKFMLESGLNSYSLPAMFLLLLVTCFASNSGDNSMSVTNRAGYFHLQALSQQG